MSLIKGSYSKDCIFLLKDLTGLLKEISVEEKEELIKKGINYSNFISKENKVSEEVKSLFLNLLEEKAKEIAFYVGSLAENIYRKKGESLVIVSLARAGTPYGILIRKYLKKVYSIDIKHYSISIIRGKGIDYNAINYILEKEKNANIQFVDGWTGKGSIINQLEESIKIYNEKYNENIDSSLAVIADPAKLCNLYGTREDISLPNSVLNSTVSGLISRTILNESYIGKDDFHGAINIDYLKDEDFSEFYIEKIEKHLKKVEVKNSLEEVDLTYSKEIVKKIKKDYAVKSINSIKLSIGEATRVLLRRKARVVFVKSIKDKEVEQLILLAKEKNVKVEELGDVINSQYKAIAIIEEGNNE